MFAVVVLVLLFGGVECCERLCGNGDGPTGGGFQRQDLFPGDLMLRLCFEIYCQGIGMAPVNVLAACIEGVHVVQKYPDQIPVGQLFGVVFNADGLPVAGALVGFVADFVGCLFSGYGYNPLFCVPPILYGVCGGLLRLYSILFRF